MTALRNGIVLVTLLVACGKSAPKSDSAGATTTAAAKPDPAVVAKAITANPAGADSILKANGYTRAEFESAMYDIAGDSAKAAAYAAAKTR